MKMMNKSLYAAAIAGVVVILCVVINTAVRAQVFTVDDDNYEAFVKEHNKAMVEFFAPWCGHCKSLAPEYTAAEIASKEMNSGVAFAMVDATNPKAAKITKDFGVDSFPTIFYLTENGSKKESYEGDRTKDAILKFIKKKMGLSFDVVEDFAILMANYLTDLGSDEESKKPVILALSMDASDLMDKFRIVSSESTSDSYRFVCSPASRDVAKSLANKFSIPSLSEGEKVVVFTYHSEPKVISSEEFNSLTSLELEQLIVNSAEAPSSAIILTEKLLRSLVLNDTNPQNVWLVEYYAPWCGYCQQFAPAYENLAKTLNSANPQRVKVAKVDATLLQDEINMEQGIEGFPTLKLYRQGFGSSQYERSFENNEAIIQWINEKVNLEVPIVTTGDMIDELMKAEKCSGVVVIPYSLISSDSTVQGKANLFAFASPSDISVVIANIPGYNENMISLIQKHKGLFTLNRDPVLFQTNVLDNIRVFSKTIRRALLPNAMEFNDDLFETILGTEIPCIVFTYIPEASNAKDTVLKILNYVGKPDRMDALFIYATKLSKNSVRFFAIDEQVVDTPTIRVLNGDPEGNLELLGVENSHDITIYNYQQVVSKCLAKELIIIERPEADDDDSAGNENAYAEEAEHDATEEGQEDQVEEEQEHEEEHEVTGSEEEEQEQDDDDDEELRETEEEEGEQDEEQEEVEEEEEQDDGGNEEDGEEEEEAVDEL